jgi:hypothetical protein
LIGHRLLLFLSANRLLAQLMAGKKIVTQQEFDGSPEGREKFAIFLKPVKCPAYLLVDLIEEDFRQETIPHLNGRTRRALLQRKFDQYYRGTPFCQAALSQRQKTGRRDDEVLFSALTNPSHLKPWLDIMQLHNIPLAGIYSVPQVSLPLIGDHDQDHLLLVSWEKFAGLRQSYFIERRLQISRLTPTHATYSFQDAVGKELGRTCQYLKSLSLLPDECRLDVRILGYGNELAGLKKNLPDRTDIHPDIRYDFVGLDEIAAKFKIGCRFTDSDASQIFLRELAAHPPKAQYANSGHTRCHTLWKLRKTLNLSSAAILVASLIWSAATVMLNSEKLTEADAVKKQAQGILAETQKITQSFQEVFPAMSNGTRAHAADMKTGVSIMRNIGQIGYDPRAILKPISVALENFPQIELENIEWRESATGRPTSDSAPVIREVNNKEIDGVVITLKASLRGFAGDYRAALAHLDSFQRELSEIGYRVAIMDKPLDISPGGTLADRRDAHDSPARFSLELFWKTPT